MGDNNAGGIGGGIVSDSYDGGGSITSMSAVLASERLRLQWRRQWGWKRLVMVKAAVAVAFMLEVFCRWKAAFIVFL